MLSEKPWRAEIVILFCVAQFVCLCLGVVALGLLHKLGVRGFQQEADLGNVLLGTLCLQGTTWLLIPVFLRLHRVGWREAFGWRGPRINQPALLLVQLIGIFTVVLLLQGLCVLVLTRLGHPPAEQAAVLLLLGAKSVWTTVYLGVFAIVLAPVAEEFIFRGVLFPFIRQLGFPRLAWLGVSALFALIHANLPTFLPLFVFALGLTWLYEKTGKLLVPIAAHALFNAFNFALLLWQMQHPDA